MTKKLFYDNSFMQEFDAVVISCEKDKKGWSTILDQTAFYPEGGGQPADHGVITFGENTANVTDTREKNGVIVHYTDAEIPAGTAVHGTIDWVRRFDFMQQHTGEHMFSGVVNSMFGYNNVGFHLSEKDNVVDFNGPLSKEDIKAVMDRCNEIVWANQPVETGFPENVKELEYRSKKELQGEIRIVRTGSADICACCGTHTATTSQAGPVVALNSQAYKGGTRISILCGKRAVEYLK
ncbi:MAG: alanyl-tRNA editing protein, partial [Oscillospiraceae bacterium]|nr:alanyl-tRNA editing protein [Oscillospiraceae bacterium]